MFKNYLVTAINSLLKNKLYSVINILGLAIGLTACILITLYVEDELSYDKHWAKSESIYRLNMTYTLPSQAPLTAGYVPGRTLPALASFFPQQFDAASRLLALDVDLKLGDNSFNEKIIWVDQGFDELFDLNVTAGSLSDSLRNTNSIALSDDLAIKLFGEPAPIGEVLTIVRAETTKDYRVGAIYQTPTNTELSLPAITLIDETEFQRQPNQFQNWFSQSMHLFLLLENDLNRADMESRFAEFTSSNIIIPDGFPGVGGTDSSNIISFELQPISNIRIDGRTAPGINGSRLRIMIFSSISVLVLLIGSINFMILTVARANQRSREIALRKTVGAKRWQLILQFLSESLLLTLLATVIALVMTEASLPLFESFLGKDLGIDYTVPETWLALLVLISGVGLLTGAYPAFFLSAFRPGSTLKNKQIGEASKTSLFRNALIVFQFTVSVSLIVATAVMYEQTAFSSNRDPGFNKENLLLIEGIDRSFVNSRQSNLMQELAAITAVTDITASAGRPMANYRDHYAVSVPANSESGSTGGSDSVGVLNVIVDYDFFETYQIPLVAGRYYHRDFLTDPFPTIDALATNRELQSNIIINETAVTRLGFGDPENALGKTLLHLAQTETGLVPLNLNIVGVVADMQFLNLTDIPESTYYPLSPNSSAMSAISLRFNGDSDAILQEVAETWRRVIGNEVLITNFIALDIEQELEQTRTEAALLAGFSLLAVCIACLGLFGVATFVVERRTRELGLRKVMGAKVKDIVYLLVWQFSKPVIFANLIAWPISAWLMLTWLQQFPYQINNFLLVPFCLVAGAVTLSIAFLTVAGNTRSIARRSPIHALRYE